MPLSVKLSLLSLCLVPSVFLSVLIPADLWLRCEILGLTVGLVLGVLFASVCVSWHEETKPGIDASELTRWRDREINLSPSADIKAAGRKNDPENTIQKGSRC